MPDTIARHRLRQTLYTLKRAGVCLEPDDGNVGLTTSKIALDFREAIAAAPRGIGPLLKAFLPGYVPSISDAFDRWLETFREQVHLQIRNALLSTIGIQRQNASWFDLEVTAKRCLEIDPLNEEATLALAEARARVGNKVAAMRLLDSYRKDLGVRATDVGLPTALLRERISDRLVTGGSPLIGREAAIGEITTLIRHLGISGGGGYLITGPAGIGKTRLIEEIRHTAALSDLSIVHTECLPSEVQYPLSVVTRIVSRIRELPGALGCSPSSLGYLKRLIDEPLDAPVDRSDTELSALTYAAVKRSILDLIEAVTHEVKLLLVIDDIDQADAQSMEIITDLVSASRSASVLVLMAAREVSEPVARLTAASRALRSHALQPLDRHDSSLLLRRLTNAHHGGLDEDQLSLYVQMAGGNPLCINELARYWESCGRLHSIPPSIESALQQRVAGLISDDLTTLQAIAVLGRHATLERLARLLEVSEAESLNRTEHLERLGFVRWDVNVATCVHKELAHLVGEALPTTAKIALHGKVAQLLRAELQPPRDSRLFWDCANHYRLAGVHREAIALFSKCSDRLRKLGLPREAASIWERAFVWCETDEERLLVQEKLIPTLRAAGELGRVSRIAQDLAQLRRTLQLGDPGWSEWQIDVLEARMYALEEVEPILIEASACLADEFTAPGTRVRAGICAMICAYNLHDAVRLTHFHNVLMSLDGDAPQPADRFTISLIFNTYVGDLEVGANAGSELVALARSSGSLTFLAQSLRRYALALRMLGRFAEARDALDEALELVRWMGSRSYELATLTRIGELLIAEGDLESAADLLNKTLRPNDRRRFPYRAISVALMQSAIALIAEDNKTAFRICEARAFRKWRVQSSRSRGRNRYELLAISALLAVSRVKTRGHRRQLLAFEAEFLRLQAFGDQDFAALALCKSWLAEGQNERAQTLLAEYLGKHRRERYPAPAYLTSLIESGTVSPEG
ncbi:MAG TPA: AAA family ATPase [Gemmatimonadaceae bacterium]|nr:AAA family ATPase [Gemmatimonadaceae bacterium]